MRKSIYGFLLSASCVLAVAGCVSSKPKVMGEPLVPPSVRAGGVPTPDIEQLLAQMTVEEKVGQMTQATRAALKGSEVRTYGLGSVLNGGNELPTPNTPNGWAEMVDRFQMHALGTRLGIPMMYGVDAVHGHAEVRGTVVFPHNIGLGATRNPEIVRKAGQIAAKEIAGTGVRWTFAPCIAVPRDERWGRTYEGFGETPELASMMAPAAVQGLQGEALGGPESVVACAKHFLADGGTQGGKDQGDARISEEELRAIHLPGYAAAVKAGVGSIMVSYSSWNGDPMHGHKRLLTDVLKGELGFKGFVVTDWEGIDHIPGSYKANVEKAINGGVDMVMVPVKFELFLRYMRDLVKTGRIPMARIDDAVRRILTVKAAAGLWEHPMADGTLLRQIGAPEHRQVAREAVRQSMVLLKNDKNTLPLAKHKSILVAGSKANDLGSQCGGWTIGWQGSTGPITAGTTILQALQKTAAKGAKVEYSTAASGAEKADVVVVVVGETPYAETTGDRDKLYLSGADKSAVANARKSGKPVVTVVISGRPLILDDVVANSDAIVAAWLPGTEGDGVADVLMGDYKPTGKLPHSWPKRMDQIPINQGDASYDPLYPYGHGLTY